MKAQQLIDGCSFGPEALKAIGQAFDAAWQEIAGNFGSDPAEIEAARLQLASALLSIASEDSRNAEVLKRAALERMALDYKDRPGGASSLRSPACGSQMGWRAAAEPVCNAPRRRQTWGFSKRAARPQPVPGGYFAPRPRQRPHSPLGILEGRPPPQPIPPQHLDFLGGSKS